MATAIEWTRGYARRALADLDRNEALESDGTALMCHRLQFVQMACEKLVKAYLCLQVPTPPPSKAVTPTSPKPC
jgi:hypothetical protein